MNQPRHITGFWHVCLINNWREIVEEQANLIISSGLYDAVRAIYIGCVGEDANAYMELVEYVGRYPKMQVRVNKSDISEYEFPTLDYMHKWCKANTDQYCFYLHTKGVYDARGNYWRGYLNHYTIEGWKHCIVELEHSFYDMVGVKWREATKHWPQHFSGNFFWATTNYISSLMPIKMLDRSHRWNAEFWHGTGNPAISSLCQVMVDHDNHLPYPKVQDKQFSNTKPQIEI